MKGLVYEIPVNPGLWLPEFGGDTHFSFRPVMNSKS
jgi:hypothetical protein